MVINGETMGTTYSVKYIGDKDILSLLKKEIEQYLDRLNSTFSTYISNSEISLLNQASNEDKVKGIAVSREFQIVLNRALEIASLSQGFFDPTVYPLVSLWKQHFKDKQDRLPSLESIVEARERVGFDKIKIDFNLGIVTLERGMSVDLSAMAKGTAVDGMATILENHFTENYLVEIGGELRAKGMNLEGEPWKILLASPSESSSNPLKERGESDNEERVVLALDSGAVATSGDYLNYFEWEGVRYSHLIDPHTGRPIRHYVTSVSVIADSCEEADAWATALIVMGKKGIVFSEENDIPAVFMVREEDGDGIHIIKNSLVDLYLK